jgi:hypothetical protein
MPLRRACEIAALVVALILLRVMGLRLSDAQGFLLANGQPLFGDFIAYWSAGRAALEGRAADVHDWDVIRFYHQLAIPGIAVLAPWHSPPTALLMASVLALMPYPAAALVFLAATGTLYLYAARKLLPDRRAMIFAATLPAALFHLGSVQTGLFIAGLSGLAIYYLDRRPIAAGAMIALLAVKPHLAVLWPVMLALSGRWRAFAAATIGVVVFAATAGIAFGFETYERFLRALSAAQSFVSEQLVSTPAYASLFANLVDLGAPREIAFALHAVSAVAAAALALWLFRSGKLDVSGAALCAATLLTSPYLFFYDFTLLAVGAALLGAPRDRFELTSLALAWAAGLSLPLGYLQPLPLCPLSAWLVLLAAARRVRAEAHPMRRTQAPPRSAQS